MRKQYYSTQVETLLNKYLNFLFETNLNLDNLVYTLDNDFNLPVTSGVIHENVAHLYPTIADRVSDFMIQCNIKPVRTGIKSDNYSPKDAYDVFEKITMIEEQNRKNIIEIIDAMDYDIECKQISVFFEDLLMESVARLHNYEVWTGKVQDYVREKKTYKLDKDIHSITGLK